MDLTYTNLTKYLIKPVQVSLYRFVCETFSRHFYTTVNLLLQAGIHIQLYLSKNILTFVY